MALVSRRPAPGPPRPFSFPSFERTQLANGLTVIACDIPGRHLCAAQLLLEAGAENEPATKAGVAALTARALTEGTQERDADSFADAVERLGADISAGAGFDIFRTAATVPVAHLHDTFALMSEAVRVPAFPPTEIERLLEERLNRIKQQRAHSGGRALLAFPQLVFEPSSAYARPTEGLQETVESLTRDDVEFYYQTFATPGSATLIVAGDLDGFDTVRVAEELLGDWKIDEPARTVPAVDSRLEERAVSFVDRPGSVQSDIIVGHPSLPRGADDRHLVDLVTEVLFGMFNSRLNMLLREEKGYTYGVRGSLETRRHAGLLFAWAPVQSPTTSESVHDIVEGFAQMNAEGMTQEELDGARDYVVGVFPLRNEAADQIASLIGQLVIYGLPDDHYDREREALQHVTVADVAEAAKRHLHPDRLGVVVVGDASEHADALRAADLGEVTVVPD
jgi:predicted Zn-dependent peptidase